ncbi:TPA: right-handed parallel beta-helix repeat-containing protein, partial [Shigella flexneri]|nr:right-handed parallel beta-helix repeat-containing protein [Shigella flexneri]
GYTFEGCDIRGNVGAGFTTVASGITAHMGPGWQFLQCNIENNGAGGIYLGVPMVDRLDVVGCRIRNNGTGNGITILNDTIQPRITGCTIQGHLGAGISMPDATRSAWNPTIQGNTITENRDGAIVNAKITNTTALIGGNHEQAAFATLSNLFSNPTYAESITNVVPTTNFSAPERVVEG